MIIKNGSVAPISEILHRTDVWLENAWFVNLDEYLIDGDRMIHPDSPLSFVARALLEMDGSMVLGK